MINRPTLALTLMATAAVPLQGGVVLDQIGNEWTFDLGATGSPNASQFFTDFAGFDAMAIDDFSVGSEQLRVVSVTSLFQAAEGTSRFAALDGYQVSIFSDPAIAAGNLDGDIASIFVGNGSASLDLLGDGVTGLVSLDLDLQLPSEGTYWLGVSPVSALGVTGQFFIHNNGADSPAPGNENGMFANPGGAFGAGSLSDTQLDFAYRVRAVPEPTLPFAFFFAGLTLLTRRRRPPRS